MSTTVLLSITAALLLSYLIGSLQPSFLLGKAIKHVDIRDYGSGNSGATNAIRVFGFKFGMVCLLIDAAKGALVILAVKLLLGPEVLGSVGAAVLLQLVCGLCVILGHNHPFYMHFRGGKGVAASIGILLMIDWRLVLIAGIPALLLLVLTRIMSVASLTFETLCFAGLAVLCFHMEFYYGILLAAFCYPLISFWRHRANLVRLAHGEESRLWGKGSRNSGPVPKDDYEEAMEKLDEQSGVDLHHSR
ncbi:MAG: glycerol-3-phosphate 1-O-acyltransferase PlsY [Clostridia bacterium]|nr:glycerol-3-phosphate 1-O-acyltransferase PlsY [Clostridia bacterium]